MTDDQVPVAWQRPYTLSDVLWIDALDEEARGVVERYVRKAAHPTAKKAAEHPSDRVESDDYVRGWEDAMEAARLEIDAIYLPDAPPRRKLRRAS